MTCSTWLGAGEAGLGICSLTALVITPDGNCKLLPGVSLLKNNNLVLSEHKTPFFLPFPILLCVLTSPITHFFVVVVEMQVYIFILLLPAQTLFDNQYTSLTTRHCQCLVLHPRLHLFWSHAGNLNASPGRRDGKLQGRQCSPGQADCSITIHVSLTGGREAVAWVLAPGSSKGAESWLMAAV